MTRAEFKAFLQARIPGRELVLHPSARLMTSPYPVSRIWEINVSSDAVDGKVEIPKEREHILIIRPHATVEVRRVSRPAWIALAALQRGEGYEGAIDSALCVNPQCDIERELAGLAAGDTFCLQESSA